MGTYRALSKTEIEELIVGGCTSSEWEKVQVGEGFDTARVRNVSFSGDIRIGRLDGTVSLNGVDLPCELADANLSNCVLKDNVRVTQIHSHLSNYIVKTGAVVTDVGSMTCHRGATFGNGVELETVNEGGGREVRIFREMSSQFAYLVAMHRYRTEMMDGLEAIVDKSVESSTSDWGVVRVGAVVAHVKEIEDVDVGPYAVISGAQSLKNGTLLSEEVARTRVGSGVVAEDFIFAEGASVEDGALLGKCFIGQGVQVGKQFSGENSLFFANSECFHGEACSVFGGPYTVTHHKSTLLIAGMFSFYNAGSGSNQSNHMYKLGPVHQGVLERGSKTGSFSYLLWPSAVGAFSVVIGKHMTNFDTRVMPFSYVTDEKGETFLTPSMNLYTVGTVRDGEKWPNRDRRTATEKRDQIRFEVLSPYTVQRMIQGETALSKLYEETSREVDQVRYNGVTIKRLVLRTGARNYKNEVDKYLSGKILEKATPVLGEGLETVRSALSEGSGIFSESWADVGGLLVSVERLSGIAERIGNGSVGDASEFLNAFHEASQAYEEDEWAWVRATFEARNGKSVDALTLEDLAEMKSGHDKATGSYIKKILADAEKEFDEIARMGYGADGNQKETNTDFEAVRGKFDENSFVKQMQAALEEVTEDATTGH